MANLLDMLNGNNDYMKVINVNMEGSNKAIEDKLNGYLDRIRPFISGLIKTTSVIKNGSTKLVEITPLIYLVLSVISIVVVTTFILWHVFFKKTNPGIEGARKAYSIFHLITSCTIAIAIFVVSNPITHEINTSSEKSELKKNWFTNLFSIINRFINIVFVPIILVETTFIVLTVFIINFMFVISSSLLRTYYAIQCPLGQSIEFNWWGRIIDLVMFCLLGVSFIIMLITQIIYGMYSIFVRTVYDKSEETSKSSQIKFVRETISLSRRFFVMTLSYYILYSLFLGIEYLISSNILAIHNWEKDDPTVVCDSEVSGVPKSTDNKLTAEYVVKIFYLIFNIVLCIAIWILIGVLIYGQGNLAGTASKLVKAIITVMEVLLHLTGGNMSEATINTAIINMFDKFKSVIPEKMIPKEYRDPKIVLERVKETLKAKLKGLVPEGSDLTVNAEKKIYREQQAQGAGKAAAEQNAAAEMAALQEKSAAETASVETAPAETAAQALSALSSPLQEKVEQAPTALATELQIKVEKPKKKGFFKK